MRIVYGGQSESRIARGSNVFHPIRTKRNVFGEDLSYIIHAKNDHFEPSGLKEEDKIVNC